MLQIPQRIFPDFLLQNTPLLSPNTKSLDQFVRWISAINTAGFREFVTCRSRATFAIGPTAIVASNESLTLTFHCADNGTGTFIVWCGGDDSGEGGDGSNDESAHGSIRGMEYLLA